MTIFNSLGSNYTLEFVMEAMSAAEKESSGLLLRKFLEEKYGGKATLVYKGREALRLALRVITPSLHRGAIAQDSKTDKKQKVGICGFTCYAVYEAVIKEGFDVVYLDVEEDLNFSFETFKNAVSKNNDLNVVIIQNTLGYPCDIEKIAKFCREKGIVLIEDLAHSIGTKYSNGKEAGTVGDFVVLSFSQDKVVDGISGGAVIARNDNFQFSIFNFQKLTNDVQKRDRHYPLFTFLIRKTYAMGLGKGLHMVLKRKKMLTQPMDNLGTETIRSLPAWYSQLIYAEFRHLDKNLSHRRNIANIYGLKLNKKLFSAKAALSINDATNLRFPIFVSNRESLIAYLKQYNIFISDIWYDAPIGPKKYLDKTNYKDQCPNAEKISERIVNLPTHKNVSEKDAKFIVEKVNEWLELEAKT